MSRNKMEYFTLLCDVVQVGLGIGYLISGEVLGVAFILLGLLSYFYRRMRERAYLDGWMHGRGNLIRINTEAESRDEFIEKMMEADLDVMRRQIGDRQTEKFIDQFVRIAARSDGSHDKL